MSGKRIPQGALNILEPDDGDPLLILPYANAEGAPGISVLDAADLKPRFEAEIDEGETLHSLHISGGGTELLALTHLTAMGPGLDPNRWLC